MMSLITIPSNCLSEPHVCTHAAILNMPPDEEDAE